MSDVWWKPFIDIALPNNFIRHCISKNFCQTLPYWELLSDCLSKNFYQIAFPEISIRLPFQKFPSDCLSKNFYQIALLRISIRFSHWELLSDIALVKTFVRCPCMTHAIYDEHNFFSKQILPKRNISAGNIEKRHQRCK